MAIGFTYCPGKKCPYCKGSIKEGDLTIPETENGETVYYHQACHEEWEDDRKEVVQLSTQG